MLHRIGLLALLALPFGSAVSFAQDAPPSDCDTYAASVLDPQRKSPGVTFEKIEPALAIPSCEAALARYPDTPRFQFQLGRAYHKQGEYPKAVMLYRSAADAGYAGAQNALGAVYRDGQGLPKDDAQAISWFRKAAEQGNTGGQVNLAAMYRDGRGVPKDDAQAFSWYRRAAEQGHAAAQNTLGVMYDDGRGVPKDDAQAFSWFRKAAEQGDIAALNNVGVMYQNGQGVPKDDAQAADWYRKAAEQGHAGAQNNLGVLYDNGRGVQRDAAQAVSWFRKAAERGHAGAQNNLGVMYRNGRGVPRDDAQAAGWYRKAAEQGHVGAQADLGVLFDHGQGVARDQAQAAFWYRKAAERGHAAAQNNLGVKYDNGHGVPRDFALAAAWFSKAAERGDQNAQENLKKMRTGRRLPRDYSQARSVVDAAMAAAASAPVPRPPQSSAQSAPVITSAVPAVQPQQPRPLPAIISVAGRRVALLIGNSEYQFAPRLRNPANDVQAVAASLRTAGFQSVTVKTDLKREDIISALREFALAADAADWAMVYYSGHGIEFSGINYMIPIDARLRVDRDIDLETVDVGKVLSSIESARRLRLVVLDACRDNPFVSQMRRTMATRSIGRGLARIEPEPGTLVVYSAKHGETALDGEGATSPFAEAFTGRILTPNLELRRLFDFVREDVMSSTNNRQQPFSYGSLPGSQDYFFTTGK